MKFKNMIELEWLRVRNEGCPSIPPHSQQVPSAQADTCLSNISGFQGGGTRTPTEKTNMSPRQRRNKLVTAVYLQLQSPCLNGT